MSRKRIHKSKQSFLEELDSPVDIPRKKHCNLKEESQEESQEELSSKYESDDSRKEESLLCDEKFVFHSDRSYSLTSTLSKSNPKAYEEYTKIRKYIEDSKPSFTQFLLTPLRTEDKAFIFEMFEVLSMIIYPSQDYIDYRNRIVHEIDAAKRRYNDYNTLSEEIKKKYYSEKPKILSLSSSLPLDFQIICLDAEEHIKSHIFREYTRLCNLNPNDDERPKLERWIYTALSMPYKRCKQLPDNRGVFLRQMKDSLDKNMHGLEKVKEQLLVFANARMSNPEMKECTLGLIGPPGIGKTMIARLIAECLTIPFAQISCGGITEADTLKGYSYTYIGSRPGEIANSLIEMKYNNGVIFFDEFEKVSDNKAITSMLLHVLDPVQNCRYQDSYLGRDIHINLSGIWFVLSMNNLPNDTALRDRIFTINLTGYSAQEKFFIAKYHLIPKILKNLRLDNDIIIIHDDTIRYMISNDNQSGVRSLNHSLRELITKTHFLQQTDMPMSFTINNIKTPFVIMPDMVDKLIVRSEMQTHMSMYI